MKRKYRRKDRFQRHRITTALWRVKDNQKKRFIKGNRDFNDNRSSNRLYRGRFANLRKILLSQMTLKVTKFSTKCTACTDRRLENRTDNQQLSSILFIFSLFILNQFYQLKLYIYPIYLKKCDQIQINHQQKGYQFQQQINPNKKIKSFLFSSVHQHMFFYPCKCECEKAIIRTEMIVIAREYSPTKTKPMVGDSNGLDTVALQPKQMEVNKRNAFRERKVSFFQNNEVRQTKQKENAMLLLPIFSSKQSVSTLAMSENPVIKNSQQLLRLNQYDHRQSQDARVLKSNSENYYDQTQRRVTMKSYNNNAGNFKREVDCDNSLTTKRCRKRQSINVLKTSKTTLPLIQQIAIANLHNVQSNKQNLPHALSQNQIIKASQIQNGNFKSSKAITLMKEEISILKSQLQRLENHQQALINENNINQKFFHQDYSINQKKKQNLKRNCNQRSQQLKQIKKLLVDCRNRNL